MTLCSKLSDTHIKNSFNPTLVATFVDFLKIIFVDKHNRLISQSSLEICCNRKKNTVILAFSSGLSLLSVKIFVVGLVCLFGWLVFAKIEIPQIKSLQNLLKILGTGRKGRKSSSLFSLFLVMLLFLKNPSFD